MKAGSARKQRTFKVHGNKITISSNWLTSRANHRGWRIKILWNGKYPFVKDVFVLTRKEAEDIAYAEWVKGCSDSGLFGFEKAI